MIALYIAAASIVAVAVALLVARTPAKLRTADQRGITLQTLIVTAVLVLMAGAAGVVIIAITNNAQDNLEGQSSDLDSRCQPWEIFDPTLEAAGRGGGQGGIGSSAIGCVRVCYIEHTTANNAIEATDDIGAAEAATALRLVMSRTDEASDDNTAASGKTNVLVVSGTDELAVKATNTDDPPSALALTQLDIVPQGKNAATDLPANAIDFSENMVIQVASNGRYCHVWDYTNDEEVLRSS